MQLGLDERKPRPIEGEESGVGQRDFIRHACLICGNQDQVCHESMYDDRYGYPGRFSMRECKSCGHKRLDASFSQEELSTLYTDFYPRASLNLADFAPRTEVHGFSAWINGELSSAFRWVPKNVRVLDIGCGFGYTLAYHQARGCEVWGVEADENIRRVADKYGFKVHVGLFDPARYEPSSFDYVTLDQVIEHVTGPIQTLLGIAQVLKPGGVVVLSTPNQSGWGAAIFRRRNGTVRSDDQKIPRRHHRRNQDTHQHASL